MNAANTIAFDDGDRNRVACGEIFDGAFSVR